MITYRGMKIERLPRKADGWFWAPISCFLMANYRGPFPNLQAAQDDIDDRERRR